MCAALSKNFKARRKRAQHFPKILKLAANVRGAFQKF